MHELHATSFSKHRLEALSDGIFAIAMTLLVLELKVPVDYPPGQLWAALGAEKSLWGSVVLTFFITSFFWTMQHHVFAVLEQVSGPHLALTFVTLGFVAVLPFSTSLLGSSRGDPVAFQIYFGNQSAIAISLALKVELARIQRGLRNDAATRYLRLRLWSRALVMLSGVLVAPFLRGSRMWIVPAALAFVTRVVQTRLRSRWRAAEAS